jgi:hypothetical protein
VRHVRRNDGGSSLERSVLLMQGHFAFLWADLVDRLPIYQSLRPAIF